MRVIVCQGPAYELKGPGPFWLLVGCDGLWDFMKEHQVWTPVLVVCVGGGVWRGRNVHTILAIVFGAGFFRVWQADTFVAIFLSTCVRLPLP
eukprot:m.266763 g.266763  ORF g.266763 m.266763 type:complete len:92 (+) comp19722_c2_seq4:534-809(+)